MSRSSSQDFTNARDFSVEAQQSTNRPRRPTYIDLEAQPHSPIHETLSNPAPVALRQNLSVSAASTDQIQPKPIALREEAIGSLARNRGSTSPLLQMNIPLQARLDLTSPAR